MEPVWPWGVIPITKKEFDELMEKAEKYDEIQESVPLICHLTFEQFVTEYKALNEKVEVAKRLVEAGPYPHMNTWEDYQRAVDDFLGKLMNVLEGEESNNVCSDLDGIHPDLVNVVLESDDDPVSTKEEKEVVRKFASEVSEIMTGLDDLMAEAKEDEE